MGGDVPPKVTYWTGVWEPHREAISKQVAALRRNLAPGAPVVSFSSGQRTSFPLRERVVRLSSRRWLLLRLIASWIERRGDTTHLVAGLESWHLLRALGRRPILFTVALPGRPLDRQLYQKVTLFAAETQELAETLVGAGVDRERIRVVYPGVDLHRFRPTPPPASGPFRLLFASSPADPKELEARGIHLLVELARSAPDLEVVALWRRWGNLQSSRRALAALDPPANFRVVERDEPDIRRPLANVHAVACFFASGFGKSCPTSVIEGLASGRPALLTESLAISALVTKAGAGTVGHPTAESLLAALSRLKADLPAFAARARRLAESHFDQERVLSAYARLYHEIGKAGVARTRR